ncbi:MAG: hypothetical protein OXD35_15690, partial [Thiotrichales bacterium]|nr:hypothetical protein [Thiotrichales bacterium]
MQVISATNGETRRHSDGRDSLSAGGQYSPNFGRRVNYRANIITGENRGTRATVAERQRQPAIGTSDAHFSLVLGKDSENRSSLDGSGSRTCEKCDRMLVFFTYALMRISHQFSARS